MTETSAGREVTVSGRLDVASVDEVRLAMHAILDRGAGDLLVHLAQAEVHDAAGLGVIVGIHHRARRMGRRLVLVDVSPRLDRLLRASRLHRVLARGPGRDGIAPRPVPENEPAVHEMPASEAQVAGKPASGAKVAAELASGAKVAGQPASGARVAGQAATQTQGAQAVTPLSDAVPPLSDAVPPLTG